LPCALLFAQNARTNAIGDALGWPTDDHQAASFCVGSFFR